MSTWNKVMKPIVVLCVICIIITGALAATNSVTAPIIAEATRLAQEKARMELLPDADGFTQVEGVSVENVSAVYTADNGVGTVVTSAAKGYGGTMTVMVAFTPDGTIKQIKGTSHITSYLSVSMDSQFFSFQFRTRCSVEMISYH